MSLSLFSLLASPWRKRHPAQRAARRRPNLELLEDRNLLSVTFSNPATLSGDVTLTGTAGADQFIVRLGATSGTGGQTIQFSDNGGTSFTTANLSGITSITVNGMGGGDRLTFDMSNGVIGRAAAALPISFDAGSGRSTLILEGAPPSTNGTVTEV